jgi:hypothetical protein
LSFTISNLCKNGGRNGINFPCGEILTISINSFRERFSGPRNLELCVKTGSQVSEQLEPGGNDFSIELREFTFSVGLSLFSVSSIDEIGW